MFYRILKVYARLMIHLYCIRIILNKPEVLNWKGPLLFAANHPNSFLDGIILTTLLEDRLYSLARGDAFKHAIVNKILRSLSLLPVYRTSEGVENLEHNYTTFKDCIAAFRKGECVLIFSEGWCENEWKLRPLKKGTARLAFSTWRQNIPLQVLPTGFNYSSFKSFGKELHLCFGETLCKEQVEKDAADGKQYLHFNEHLQKQLEGLVYRIDENDKQKHDELFPRKKGPGFYLMLLPGVAGWLLHAPLFLLCTLFAKWKFANSGHYDSVQTSLLLLWYPLYVILLMVFSIFIHPLGALLTPVVLYATAWMGVRIKYALYI